MLHNNKQILDIVIDPYVDVVLQAATLLLFGLIARACVAPGGCVPVKDISATIFDEEHKNLGFSFGEGRSSCRNHGCIREF